MSIKTQGYTAIESIIVLAIVIVISAVIVFPYILVNNRGATETRAEEGAKKFIEKNKLEVSRLSCAGDSDNDGYGTCTLTLKNKERLRIACPTDWMDTRVWGASNCKEVFTDLNIEGSGALPIEY